MVNKSKVVATLMSLTLFLSTGMPVLATSQGNQSTNKSVSVLVYNGQSIKTLERSGIIYAPLAKIVQDAGDQYQWDAINYTATVTKKDKTVVQVSIGKTVAKVNGKELPLSVQKVKGVNVPAPAKAFLLNEDLYVSCHFLSTVLKYPVQFKAEEQKGQLLPQSSTPVKYDLSYQPPAGWVVPQIKSIATSDKKRNLEILDKALGFYNLGGAGAIFNPYGKGDGADPILVGSDLQDSYDVSIRFKYWEGGKTFPEGNKIPYVTRELFKFYLGQEDGLKLFKIMDDGYNGKDVSQYIGKMLTFGNRQVTIMEVQDSVRVIIGKAGVKYDSKWNVIK
ncbi:stalk domain-containing protein [Brevibacillus agri]|uniref:stalk domain-containing protein n=1 Tax=Brevibacillus TaxID=55080 RepID=UPI0015621C25|nr:MULTISPECIES: stalk domain-containing protein [Brevibacillus]MBE5394518.1 hypothetical protein [Brevibacillus borstelensis]MED1646009.1 stalk domain-containing protein [Brevibacillus agri]MED1656322.1 stalk domain-containing protein [Brevibacillus agri]MED1689244.1 stalk domain-containing protein [Brevibacillus agri]MED1693767.1 stalk domain-containing protein [Brevibacillus agri]